MTKKILTGLFAANLIAILLLWWAGSKSLVLTPSFSGILIGLGRLAGLLLEFTILVQLLLISRTPFIEKAYGFDKLNRLHRLIGYTLSVCLFIHPILITWGYSNLSHVSMRHQFLDFISTWEDVGKAVLGIAILIGAIILSLPFVRKYLKYGSWHASHLFMYVAIALFFGHQINTADVSYGLGLYYWITLNFTVFGLVILYRFLQPFLFYYRHRFVVSKVVQETASTSSIYISGKQMNRFKFQSGQYINISFMKKGLWHPHPFSFSSAFNGQYLRISIKAAGDFTSRISEITPETKALIEGPFGRFTESVARGDKFLLIAGGIGITPIRALAETLQQKSKDTALLYSNTQGGEVAFKDELQRLSLTNSHFLAGRITGVEIERLAPDYRSREIYICGPVGMIESLTLLFKQKGVPSSQIHFEKFAY
jgi:predicted ferric reductase